MSLPVFFYSCDALRAPKGVSLMYVSPSFITNKKQTYVLEITMMMIYNSKKRMYVCMGDRRMGKSVDRKNKCYRNICESRKIWWYICI